MFLVLAAVAAPCTFDDPDTTAWLVTFVPGPDVNTAFGHSALLVYQPRRASKSWVYDYGHFDASSLWFVWEFLNADQDYWVERRALGRVATYYEHVGRPGIAQRLDLSSEQVRELGTALHAETGSDERFFRYNWFGPNCSTQLVDKIDDVLDGVLEPQFQDLSDTSARDEVLRHSRDSALWFGLHWGSGRRAAEPITIWETFFMPDRLMEGIRRAEVDGRALVAEECELTNGSRPWPSKEAPSRLGLLGGIGLAVGAGLGAAGSFLPRVAKALVGVGGIAGGLFGCAALLIGVLGTFAPHWGHHNLAFVSPLSFLFTVAAVVSWRAPEKVSGVAVAGVPVGVALLGVLWALVSGFADRNLDIIALVLPVLLGAAWCVRPRR